MRYDKLKLMIIKKIRDIIFLIIFGRGKFFLFFLRTNLKHMCLGQKYNYDFKNTNFSNKWFFDNLSYIYLIFKKKKNQINSVLEIGSYEGQSASFFLKYFPNIKISCVDIWKNQNLNYKNVDFNNIEKRFDKNLEDYKNQVRKYKGTSKNFFFQNNIKNFDLIYIDGSHYFKHVYHDALKSFKILNINGYILFDDYLFKYKSEKYSHPIYAINKFLKKYKNKIKIIAIYRQVLIQKISE